MRTFFQQLAVYIILAVILSVCAALLPIFAPAGWVTTVGGVIIWLLALVFGFRAISWGARVYLDEIAPRTRSDADSPFLINTIRNLLLAIFLFVVGGGIATTINEEFNAAFFASGIGFAFSLGLAPVVGAYILDVRRAAIIDKELNEGDYVQIGDVVGFVLGQDANFLELLQIPEMRDIQIDHSTVTSEFVVLERFEEIDYDLNAVGASLEETGAGYVYTYTDKYGKPQTKPIDFREGVHGQIITQFQKYIGYYRIIGDPLITLEVDADGARAAKDPQGLLEAMIDWASELPDEYFDKTWQPRLYAEAYIPKSSDGDGACVPGRIIVKARSYQLQPEAERVAQTLFALKALAGGWGYGTTSNITIGNAADFRE